MIVIASFSSWRSQKVEMSYFKMLKLTLASHTQSHKWHTDILSLITLRLILCWKSKYSLCILRDNILFDHILDWGWCKLFYGNCFILSNKTLCIINWRKYLDYEYSQLIWMTVSRVYHPNSYFWSLIVWTVLCKQFYFTKQNILYHQLVKSVDKEYYPCIRMLVSWEYNSSACLGTRIVPTKWVGKVKKSQQFFPLFLLNISSFKFFLVAGKISKQ